MMMRESSREGSDNKDEDENEGGEPQATYTFYFHNSVARRIHPSRHPSCLASIHPHIHKHMLTYLMSGSTRHRAHPPLPCHRPLFGDHD